MGMVQMEEKTIGIRYSLQPILDAPSFLKQRIVIPRRVSDALEAKGFEVDSDGIVRWAEGSTTHPRRWPPVRKTYDTAVICFLEFFITFVSNTGSSIAPFVAEELGISRQTAVFCLTTMYLIGQAAGGLVFPPIAESFGGRTIYLTSTFGFALLCAIIPAWPTLPVVVTSRFITGLLSAMPCVVAAGSIENSESLGYNTDLKHLLIMSNKFSVGHEESNIHDSYLDSWSCGWTCSGPANRDLYEYLRTSMVSDAIFLTCFKY
jgi:hypothetical protein